VTGFPEAVYDVLGNGRYLVPKVNQAADALSVLHGALALPKLKFAKDVAGKERLREPDFPATALFFEPDAGAKNVLNLGQAPEVHGADSFPFPLGFNTIPIWFFLIFGAKVFHDADAPLMFSLGFF
jgi:hypothetical protein